MRYWGIDWVAMVSSFGALELLGSRNRLGFGLFLIANVCWIVIGYEAGSVAIILGNVIFFGLNLRGLIRWPEQRSTMESQGPNEADTVSLTNISAAEGGIL